ncbi:holo-[acyl-carrier protein] synthase [Phycicoccus badiiscoriae]|uniref:Holo-[acyl-carrier-protein] synthase n=1 Tax=Pedococcus badiiscoriae TaxID=642776 RepID=A0A852WQ79_9MICO|nr:holo-ACP synthase [Pedococcus badiiscoriae]NYG07392.1 holo-[acyl-carrier protein] synthase [Pedococcus badiiscoriae]
MGTSQTAADHDHRPFEVRVGTDIQSVPSMERSLIDHGDRFMDRIFTEHEVASCGGRSASPRELAPGLAARFCAKEAIIKLLRPMHEVPLWREMEVLRHESGWTEVSLTGTASDLAKAAQIGSIALSMSHGSEYAVATVIGVIFEVGLRT